jgi:hypothetical protein
MRDPLVKSGYEAGPFRSGPIGVTINQKARPMTKRIVPAMFAMTCLAIIWIVGAPAYGAEQTPQNTGVQKADKSQEECIARRQREGLNIRFALHRCVDPNN